MRTRAPARPIPAASAGRRPPPPPRSPPPPRRRRPTRASPAAPAQGTKDEADAMREVLSPSYKRWRGGIEHLAANARDQGFPGPRSYLRGAFPDRTDTIEEIIAEGDRVGMLFRVRGTHEGNFFGI